MVVFRHETVEMRTVVPKRVVSGHETVEIYCAGGAGGLLVVLFSYIAVTKPIIQ